MDDMHEDGNTSESVQTKWRKKMAELDAYGQREGEDVPLDNGIKEAVAALNLLGVETTASCSGSAADHNGKSTFPMLQGILTGSESESRNTAARERVTKLLAEFNQGRLEEIALILNPNVVTGFRIESAAGYGGADGALVIRESAKYDAAQLAELAQEEMSAFGKFLRAKVFGS